MPAGLTGLMAWNTLMAPELTMEQPMVPLEAHTTCVKCPAVNPGAL